MSTLPVSSQAGWTQSRHCLCASSVGGPKPRQSFICRIHTDGHIRTHTISSKVTIECALGCWMCQ